MVKMMRAPNNFTDRDKATWRKDHIGFSDKLKRVYRKLRGKCVVCGKSAGGSWFCSITCSCYDGCFTMNMSDPRADKDGWIRKPELFRGYTQRYYRGENYN